MGSLVSWEAEREDRRGELLSLLHFGLEQRNCQVQTGARSQPSSQQQCSVQAAEGSKGPTCLERASGSWWWLWLRREEGVEGRARQEH